MSREDRWEDRERFHKDKMDQCKEAYRACFKAFRDDPKKKPLLDTIWQEYERHKERASNCANMIRGAYELPARS